MQSAALLVRRDAAEAVGYLDPAFFVYSDEVDFCKRLRDAGWDVLYVPAARAVGHEQLLDERRTARRIVELSRNRDRYMRKHHGAAAARTVRWLTALTYGMRALAALVLPGHEARRYVAPRPRDAVPGPRRGAGRERGRLQPRRAEAVVARGAGEEPAARDPSSGACSCCCRPGSSRPAGTRERARGPARRPRRGRRRARRGRLRRTAACRPAARADRGRPGAAAGAPRPRRGAIVVFDAAQYPLARALLAEHPEAELWYGGSGGGDLHEAALARAALRFGGDADAPARERNRPLWERMEALGIESGRLGSERAPQPG